VKRLGKKKKKKRQKVGRARITVARTTEGSVTKKEKREPQSPKSRGGLWEEPDRAGVLGGGGHQEKGGEDREARRVSEKCSRREGRGGRPEKTFPEGDDAKVGEKEGLGRVKGT